jgi:putative spermidine/putrescine transport system ATP-binding protein
MTRPTVLELRGVGKHFGPVTAVTGVDLELKQGEFISFLGPSGSGKTTTLMMVAGLQTPSEGSILLNGRDLVPLPPYKRNIGVVFQHYALFPHMSVAANIAFPLEMRKVGRADARRRVEAAMKLVGLPGLGDRLPSQLSGGQQQRVALARALAYEPPLLLMDEPLGALDKNLRAQMQIEISRLHRDLGITVLYVTHDQEEALVMSDRIAVFNHGRIEQIGAPQALYERPMTRFVAGFLGDSTFLPGKVQALHGAEAVVLTAQGPLRGHAAPGVRAGEAAVVAVRPERVALLTPGEAASKNGLRGRISDVIYLGQSRKFVVRLEDGAEFLGLQPIGSASVALTEGTEVLVGWAAADCNVLPDAG